MKITRSIPTEFVILMILLFVVLSGCGRSQGTEPNPLGAVGGTDAVNGSSNVRIIKNKEGVPVLKNMELGVELPVNVHTDWKVIDEEWIKMVVFYSDPYKQGYPPYEEGKSPDIEKVIYINNYDYDIKLKPDADKFEGTWIGGLNEIVQGNLMASDSVDRNKIHFLCAFTLRKSPKTGKYEVGIQEFTIASATEADIKDWQSRGGKDPITIALTQGRSNYLGYDSWSQFFDKNKTQVKINGDRLTIELYDSDSKAGHLEMAYHPENDSMEIEKVEFSPLYRQYYETVTGGFGLRNHNDILKRYPYLQEEELMAGLLQMKIDQMKDAHPEFTGYRNLMLDFPHKESIPGTFNPTKTPKPSMPPAPKWPSQSDS